MIYQKTQAKKIISDKTQLTSIVKDTLKQMADITSATLGPGGRPAVIERTDLPPLITKDGVTVVKALGVSNAEHNVIIESAKEICINTAKEAGDGTTTAIIIASAIVDYGMEFLNANPKYNPQRFVNEIQEVYKSVIVPFLKKNAIKAETEAQLENVAAISANGDREIARVVVEAVMAAGDDGVVLLEESQDGDIRVETVDGYVITSGLKELGQIGPAFINDRGNQQVKMDQGLVFLFDGSLTDVKALAIMQDALENTDALGKPIIVMAHDFSDLVLDRCAKTTKGGVTVVPVKTPRSGQANSRSMMLRDLSAYTGAVVHDPGNIMEFDEQSFGVFDNAKVSMYETFISSLPEQSAIDTRVEELKGMMASTNIEFEKMFIRANISRLTGGISTIWIGGMSDLEIREKKGRIEDAVEAVRSAIAEGVVPGGCTTHLSIIREIMAKYEGDGTGAVQTLINALHEPLNRLLSNCGEDYDAICPQLQARISQTDGLSPIVFDANEHKMVDPFEQGIIEPAKVVRVSIANALSVATLLITIGGIVVVPRNEGLENQLAMSQNAMKMMMDSVGDQ